MSPSAVLVDASVLVDALTTRGAAGDGAREALRGRRWLGPEHLRVEVLHAVRGRLLGGKLDADPAGRAVRRLTLAAIDVVPTAPLLARMWELRSNLSGYDAAYVAAAEHVGCPLITGDERIAGAPGISCELVIVSTDR